MVVYEVVRVAVLTGWSSARCCAAFIACNCASVGAVGLLWLVHTLYGLLWVASTMNCVTKTCLPASAEGKLLTLMVTLSVPVVLSVAY